MLRVDHNRASACWVSGSLGGVCFQRPSDRKVRTVITATTAMTTPNAHHEVNQSGPISTAYAFADVDLWDRHT